MKRPDRQRNISHLRRLLTQVRNDMLRAEQAHRSVIARLPPTHRAGARRLLDDAVIRKAGRERIETLLRACGFPFAFSEQGDARRDLETISFLLLLQAGDSEPALWNEPGRRAEEPARVVVERTNQRIFGPRRGPRATRIMVTLPPETPDEPQILRACFASGMDAVRINCARDNAESWKRLITRVRLEGKRLHRRCSVFMDLGGPKLRTGPVPSEPAVVKITPVRDSLGTVILPARVTFVPTGVTPRPEAREGPIIPVTASGLAVLPEGSRLVCRDARGLRRTLNVVESAPSRLVCDCRRSAYIVPGIRVTLKKKPKSKPTRKERAEFRVANFAGEEGGISLARGTHLKLLPHPARPVPGVTLPAVIGLTTSIDVARIPVGTRVLFDDGKLEGRITGVRESALDVEITFAAGGTKKLRADRGVSFPGIDLNLPAMTEKDREDIGFAARHADLVALSFVRRANDVRTLREALTRRGARKIPIVVKIENASAVEFLDEILLEALRHDFAAILVGRGDLAVECGFASLPLLQREILRRSHLAGLPVILATEVLENLSRRGVPTRSDMTDADFAGETECVLLNKGNYVAESVALLNRMYVERGRLRNGTKSIRK